MKQETIILYHTIR